MIYKKSILQLPINKVPVNSGYLNIASPELTALDLVMYPSRSGGLNHIATVLSELVESINAKELIRVAAIIGEKASIQRLGYILDQIDFDDDTGAHEIIRELEIYLGDIRTFYTPLCPDIPKAYYPRIKKWKVIANAEVESDI